MVKSFFCSISIAHLFLFAACNEARENINSSVNKDDKAQNKANISIIGKWGGLGETTPVWDIRKDSIYYFLHSKAYPYKIIDRDMVISFQNSSAVFKNIHVVKDTLFFTDDMGMSLKALRFK